MPFIRHSTRINVLSFAPAIPALTIFEKKKGDERIMTTIATGTDNGQIRLWDFILNTTQEVQPAIKVQGSSGPISIRSITFSDDGRLMTALASDNSLRLWSMSPRRPCPYLPYIWEAMQQKRSFLQQRHQLKIQSEMAGNARRNRQIIRQSEALEYKKAKLKVIEEFFAEVKVLDKAVQDVKDKKAHKESELQLARAVGKSEDTLKNIERFIEELGQAVAKAEEARTEHFNKAKDGASRASDKLRQEEAERAERQRERDDREERKRKEEIIRKATHSSDSGDEPPPVEEVEVIEKTEEEKQKEIEKEALHKADLELIEQLKFDQECDPKVDYEDMRRDMDLEYIDPDVHTESWLANRSAEAADMEKRLEKDKRELLKMQREKEKALELAEFKRQLAEEEVDCEISRAEIPITSAGHPNFLCEREFAASIANYKNVEKSYESMVALKGVIQPSEPVVMSEFAFPLIKENNAVTQSALSTLKQDIAAAEAEGDIDEKPYPGAPIKYKDAVEYVHQLEEGLDFFAFFAIDESNLQEENGDEGEELQHDADEAQNEPKSMFELKESNPEGEEDEALLSAKAAEAAEIEEQMRAAGAAAENREKAVKAKGKKVIMVPVLLNFVPPIPYTEDVMLQIQTKNMARNKLLAQQAELPSHMVHAATCGLVDILGKPLNGPKWDEHIGKRTNLPQEERNKVPYPTSFVDVLHDLVLRDDTGREYVWPLSELQQIQIGKYSAELLSPEAARFNPEQCVTLMGKNNSLHIACATRKQNNRLIHSLRYLFWKIGRYLNRSDSSPQFLLDSAPPVEFLDVDVLIRLTSSAARAAKKDDKKKKAGDQDDELETAVTDNFEQTSRWPYHVYKFAIGGVKLLSLLQVSVNHLMVHKDYSNPIHRDVTIMKPVVTFLDESELTAEEVQQAVLMMWNTDEEAKKPGVDGAVKNKERKPYLPKETNVDPLTNSESKSDGNSSSMIKFTDQYNKIYEKTQQNEGIPILIDWLLHVTIPLFNNTIHHLNRTECGTFLITSESLGQGSTYVIGQLLQFMSKGPVAPTAFQVAVWRVLGSSLMRFPIGFHEDQVSQVHVIKQQALEQVTWKDGPLTGQPLTAAQDTHFVVSGSQDETVRVWDFHKDELDTAQPNLKQPYRVIQRSLPISTFFQLRASPVWQQMYKDKDAKAQHKKSNAAANEAALNTAKAIEAQWEAQKKQEAEMQKKIVTSKLKQIDRNLLVIDSSETSSSAGARLTLLDRFVRTTRKNVSQASLEAKRPQASLRFNVDDHNEKIDAKEAIIKHQEDVEILKQEQIRMKGGRGWCAT
jgi:hypothetical protein